MKIPIRFQYIFTFVLLSAAMYFSIHFYGDRQLIQTLISEKEDSLYEEAVSLSENYFFDTNSLGHLYDHTEQQLRERLESLRSMTHARYFVVDDTGQIRVDSTGTDNLEGQNFNDIKPGFLDDTTFTGHLDNTNITAEILAVIYPLSEDYDMTGYLVLMTSLDDLHADANKYIRKLDAYILFFCILLLITMFFLTHHATKPLFLMTAAVKEYTKGQFENNLDNIHGKEYLELAAAVKNLAVTTKNTSDYQKNFIANVSHDFRSPLTSIKGYVEAMLDGTIPPDIQEKYLNIILQESERLQKLTEQLLELNQYEANGILLKYSTFDINELIKNAANTFEKQCTEKKISIRLIFNNSSLFVDADRDKISQVIQNLLDNAVKFSQPDSSIEIETTNRFGKAFVTVIDHGVGISSESLSHIWERFYKSDISRGRSKTSTGLGLAITKEIIEAHHEHIHASSIPGNNTSFSFTLQCHERSYY